MEQQGSCAFRFRVGRAADGAAFEADRVDEAIAKYRANDKPGPTASHGRAKGRDGG